MSPVTQEEGTDLPETDGWQNGDCIGLESRRGEPLGGSSPSPSANELAKTRFRALLENGVQTREDSILNPSPVHRWRRGLRLQVARRPVQVRRG